MRGTGLCVDPIACQPRFIPACAGNSRIRINHNWGHAVHPRVCGEQSTTTEHSLHFRGSSPRVRGTVDDDRTLSPLPRFIPACAGNRRRSSARGICGAVHPRVCGEQTFYTAREVQSRGSSPRVRGTVLLLFRDAETRRFIPACAGNRGDKFAGYRAAPVHPRVCGEQFDLLLSSEDNDGSSPRVRGTGEFGVIDAFKLRFIPACAGNSRHQ